MDKEYKKIKLREFRQNLTQLKDSIQAGQIYEIYNRGEPLALFVPSQYEIKIKKKGVNQEDFVKAIDDAVGCVNMPRKRKGQFDYKEEYTKLLEKKYMK